MSKHALQIADDLLDKHGEVVVQLADGWTLRSGVCAECDISLVSGDYVRLVNPDEQEYLYWSASEWENNPILVMGAIINSAAGWRPFLAQHSPQQSANTPGVNS